MMFGRSSLPLGPLVSIALLALLAACGKSDEATDRTTADGVERANADIRAAEAAMRAPVAVNRSVGDLTGKSGKDERNKPAPEKAAAKADAEPAPPAAEPSAPVESAVPAAAPAPAQPPEAPAR